jgi:hypothetical protein
MDTRLVTAAAYQQWTENTELQAVRVVAHRGTGAGSSRLPVSQVVGAEAVVVAAGMDP